MPRSPERPRILVTVRRPAPDADAAAVERIAVSTRCYADAVRAAGGEPLLVGAGDPIPERYDGLLLSGGADVHPRYYRQPIDESVRSTLTIDDARDALEIPLARRALEADRPALCICRGIQLINVAAGGSLWQDLSLTGVDPRVHSQDGRLESWEYGQQIVVEAGSRLAGMVGQGFVGVNTYHHQAVADPAAGFRVTALSTDGVIEGLESTQHRFVVGVQWHPERLVARHLLHRALFARLVEAAART
jgi:putative glutamine amidotransferase